MSRRPSIAQAQEWNFRADGIELRDTDLAEQAIAAIRDVETLADQWQSVAVILKELFSNSLEHGLLHLDSALKSHPEHFTAYYEERQRRLDSLSTGSIEISLDFEYNENEGGRLQISVSDSGAGFDFAKVGYKQAASKALSGRGIMIIRGLCQELNYEGCGNRVRAVYAWTSSTKESP